MSVTWGRILVGVAVAMCLLGVGVLEVLSERGQSRVLPEPSRIGEVRPESWGEFGRVDPTLTADADVLTTASLASTTTAIERSTDRTSPTPRGSGGSSGSAWASARW